MPNVKNTIDPVYSDKNLTVRNTFLIRFTIFILSALAIVSWMSFLTFTCFHQRCYYSYMGSIGLIGICLIIGGATALLYRYRRIQSQDEILAYKLKQQIKDEKSRKRSDIIGEIYGIFGQFFGLISAIATFICAWGYCAITYGFLLGFGLGWLPAAILALIVYGLALFFWPIAIFVIFELLKQ
jgi:hypothetical protein